MTEKNITNTDYKIGIGITNSGWYFIEGKDNGEKIYHFKVSLDGTVSTNKVVVVEMEWYDKVFYPNYNLMPIDSLHSFVQTNNHLPNIPSEQEIIDNGLNLGQMQALQMQKIEELTLYIIELNTRIEALEQENELLKTNNQ